MDHDGNEEEAETEEEEEQVRGKLSLLSNAAL
jgi:hypothetical protein